MTRMTDFWDIACDLCGNWAEGTMPSTAKTRKRLKLEGWTVVRTTLRQEDRCPVCNGSDLQYWNNRRFRG